VFLQRVCKGLRQELEGRKASKVILPPFLPSSTLGFGEKRRKRKMEKGAKGRRGVIEEDAGGMGRGMAQGASAEGAPCAERTHCH
jgi:hypothetical protein